MLNDPDKFLKYAVGAGLLLAGAGVGYHFGVYIPSVEQQKISMRQEQIEREERARRVKQELLERLESQRKDKYKACLDDAEANYQYNWERDCKRLKRGKNCALPIRLADGWNSSLSEDERKCLEEFKLGV